MNFYVDFSKCKKYFNSHYISHRLTDVNQKYFQTTTLSYLFDLRIIYYFNLSGIISYDDVFMDF